tara:strand:+ start:2238 stop:2630 length:393 start_codon:yes stop_codon:yes gene_type:complete
MTTVFYSTYINKCCFSKKIIKPGSLLCVFTQQQYNEFERIINNLLSKYLSQDLINLIINYTNYKKLIGRHGLNNYSNWLNNHRLSPLDLSLVFPDADTDELSDNLSESSFDLSDNLSDDLSEELLSKTEG